MDILGGIGNFLTGAYNTAATGVNTLLRGDILSGPAASGPLPTFSTGSGGLNYNIVQPAYASEPTPQAPAPAPVIPPTQINRFVPPSVSSPALTTTQQGLAQSAQEQVDAQTGLTQSQINELSLAYDTLAQKLGIAKADATNVYQTGSQDVANRFQEATGLYDNAGRMAQTRGEQLGSDALRRFQDIQLLNRNIARSQGALSSSYYGNLQNQAGLNYGRERGDIGQNTSNQLSLIEAQKGAVAREAANAQQKLADEWQRNVANIQIDETLSQKEKAAKINTARSELEARISSINDGLAKFNASLGQTQAQIDASLDTARMYASSAGGFGGGSTQPGAGLTPDQAAQNPQGYVTADALRKSIEEQKNNFYNIPLFGGIFRAAGV